MSQTFGDMVLVVNSKKDIPNATDYKESSTGEYHMSDRNSVHSLECYEKVIYSEGNIEVLAKYSVCPKCSRSEGTASVRNKSFAVLDNGSEARAYVRYLVRNGE